MTNEIKNRALEVIERFVTAIDKRSPGSGYKLEQAITEKYGVSFLEELTVSQAIEAKNDMYEGWYV